MALPFSKASQQKIRDQYMNYLETEGKDEGTDEKYREDLQQQQEVEEEEEEMEVLRCGYGPCKPDCMQSCNKPSMLLVCVCWFTLTQGFLVNGVINVNMSTIERRFALSSGQVAWISSSYDIMAGMCSAIFGYIGTFVHNGLILTMGAYAMSLGALIMFLPHVLAGNYQLGQATSELCEPYGNETECVEGENLEDSIYLAVFITGQLCNGIGGSALYTLAVPYMDSNIRIRDTPLYIGIMSGFACLGPALGYICGGYFLTLYVDIGRVDEDDITVEPKDPRWVGAYWIGYLCAFFMALIAAFLMCCFPKELPTAVVYRKERKSQAYKGRGEDIKDENFGRTRKDLKVSVKLIVCNPIWILSCLAGILQSGTVIAFAVFLPKLMQYQFALTPGLAAAAAGVVVIPGAAGGQILGGLIPRWFNFRLRGMLGQCFTSSILVMITAFIYLIRCQMPQIAGVTVPYFNTTTDLGDPDVAHGCNSHCGCTTESYDPICGIDGVQYFSPCYAGCLDSEEDQDGDVTFFNCSCVSEPVTMPWKTPHAQDGICDEDCTTELVVFLILFLFQMLATFAGNTAGQTGTIRCIPDKQRSFALGLQALVVRYCGNVPAPLIFGAIFDQSCLMWQEKCFDSGSCWIYDSTSLAWGMSWAVFIVSTGCAICYAIAIFVYKPPAEDDEDDIILDVKPTDVNKSEPIKTEQTEAPPSYTSNGDVAHEKSNVEHKKELADLGNGHAVTDDHVVGFMNAGFKETEMDIESYDDFTTHL